MAKSTYVGGVLRRELASIVEVLRTISKRDGVAMPQNDVLNAISTSLVFIVKALWIRVIDVAFVERFADLLPSVQKVLKNHDFDALIYTYRSLNTNLYTQKTSKGRKYTLNKTTFTTFLNDVIAGKQNVLSRGKTTPKGKPMKNTLANKLFNSFAATTSTPTTKPQAKPQAKQTKKSDANAQKWVAVKLKDATLEKFHKIVKQDKTAVMGWLVGIDAKQNIIVRNFKNTQTTKVAVKDVAEVFSYVRKQDR